jgi:phosphatidylethanolamine-binding protein (PEBP) family uncharacterized protein
MSHVRVPSIVAAFLGAAVLAVVSPAAAQSPAALTLTSPAFADGAVMPKHYVVPSLRPVSPPLVWTGAPAGTKQFALVMEDVSFDGFGPGRPLVHWVVYGIPGSAAGLPEHLPNGTVKKGPLAGTIQGPTFFDAAAGPGRALADRSDASYSMRDGGSASFFWRPAEGAGPAHLGAQKVTTMPRPASVPRYRPPMPLGDGPHRYVFTLYALDADVQLPAGLDAADLMTLIKSNVLAEATLAGVGPG